MALGMIPRLSEAIKQISAIFTFQTGNYYPKPEQHYVIFKKNEDSKC